MSKVRRSPSIRLAIPPRTPASNTRKLRLGSQCTLDTNQQQSQIDTLLKVNEDDLQREIAKSLRAIEQYRSNLMKQKEGTEREQLREKELTIQAKEREIVQLNEQISRLKEVYNRPKVKRTAATEYSQHLRVFTLAQELGKQRKHLQLHIEQHQKLKQRASEMHNTIKGILPDYYYLEKKRGLKPISYGDFRRKAIMQQRQREVKQRIRSSLSQRSLSSRSRASSVKQIVEGKASVVGEGEKDLYHIQKKRSIIHRARGSSQRKHTEDLRTLSEKLEFLRKEDGLLGEKLRELVREADALQAGVGRGLEFTFVGREGSKFSKNTE